MAWVIRIKQQIFFFSFDSVAYPVNWNVYIGLYMPGQCWKLRQFRQDSVDARESRLISDQKLTNQQLLFQVRKKYPRMSPKCRITMQRCFSYPTQKMGLYIVVASSAARTHGKLWIEVLNMQEFASQSAWRLNRKCTFQNGCRRHLGCRIVAASSLLFY